MDSTDSRATAYSTVSRDSVHEVEIKRSRFITYLFRVATEAQARDRIAALRKTHFDARHHCSAFVLGPDRMIQRSNDDGEPSGTAGIPMLEALAKRDTGQGTELSDVLAVCVRYFGGIKLGAGGLVRAYSDSVSQALDHSILLRRQRLRIFALPAPHALAARWENELRAAGYQLEPSRWEAEHAVLQVGIDDTAIHAEQLAGFTAAMTSGAGRLSPVDTRWVDLS